MVLGKYTRIPLRRLGFKPLAHWVYVHQWPPPALKKPVSDASPMYGWPDDPIFVRERWSLKGSHSSRVTPVAHATGKVFAYTNIYGDQVACTVYQSIQAWNSGWIIFNFTNWNTDKDNYLVIQHCASTVRHDFLKIQFIDFVFHG